MVFLIFGEGRRIFAVGDRGIIRWYAFQIFVGTLIYLFCNLYANVKLNFPSMH